MKFNVDRRVWLNDFAGLVEIVRDKPFFCCGKIPTEVDEKLVPIGSHKHLRALLTNPRGTSSVVCPRELVAEIPQETGVAVSDKPFEMVVKIHEILNGRPGYYWTSEPSRIDRSAMIHPHAYVAARDVTIGANVVIEPNASILPRTIIGDNCLVGSNTVIGTHAFELVTIDGNTMLIPQAGGVRIGEGVIFLSGCAVARSCFPLFTEIGDFAAFDNLVHVAHDCTVGPGAKMTACSMLSGRVKVGSHAYLGPNSTISNGVTVGEESLVSIGSVAIKDVEHGEKVTGNFALSHAQFTRNFARSRKR